MVKTERALIMKKLSELALIELREETEGNLYFESIEQFEQYKEQTERVENDKN